MAGSARGLFRATGKKSKPVAVRGLDGVIVKAEHLERESEDFYATPPEPTRALLHAEGARLREFPAIWEPAAGDGAMVREMRALGFNVFASDLVDRGCGAEIRSVYDFEEAPAPAMLTNPPYDECNWRDGRARWPLHALGPLGLEYMALLLNWNWPATAGLAPLFSAFPPARVYVLTWKIDFTGQGAPPNCHGWFVWDRKHAGGTILRRLDRADARQGELFSAGA